ncbi:MAG: hypothetical protein DPW11_04810 [bacterium]|nr:hypothetical protein [Candidatus Microgenomates bacterium CPR3]MCQ3945063.1 hypothetical protein [bacterium]RIK51987.1 MAG: hypothetical protein DCC61_01195 [Candidatus Microgenomates bacterium]
MGIVLSWLLSFGKWAVIITQLIVMGAFLWRFSLDRELTDLKKSIAKNVAVIKSYEQIERDFVLTQKRLATAKTVIAQQKAITEELSTLASVTPLDVWYEKLTITPTSTTLAAYSRSLPGFSQFLSAIQRDTRYNSVSVARIQDGGVQNAQMQFEVSMGRASVEKKK